MVVEFEKLETQGAGYGHASMFPGNLAMFETNPAYSGRALRKARAGFLPGYGSDLDEPALRLYASKGALTVAADSPRHADRRLLRRLAELGRAWLS